MFFIFFVLIVPDPYEPRQSTSASLTSGLSSTTPPKLEVAETYIEDFRTRRADSVPRLAARRAQRQRSLARAFDPWSSYVKSIQFRFPDLFVARGSRVSAARREPRTRDIVRRGARADHMDVKYRLYELFISYALRSDPQSAFSLSRTSFRKLIRNESKNERGQSIIDGIRLLDEDVSIIYASSLHHHHENSMDYSSFLNAILAIANKRLEDPTPRARLKNYVVNYLLSSSSASDSCRIDFLNDDKSGLLASNEMRELKRYFGVGLESLFTHYATHDDNKIRQRLLDVRGGGGDRDDAESIASSSVASSTTANNRSPRKRRSEMRSYLRYEDFLSQFCVDFDLGSVPLSAYDMGRAYLSVLVRLNKSLGAKHPDAVGRLDFDSFWEVLVRCSEFAYGHLYDVTPENRLKALLIHLWKGLDRIEETYTGRRYGDALMRACTIFNQRFTAMWARDGHRDYLSPIVEVTLDGRELLDELFDDEDDGGGEESFL